MLSFASYTKLGFDNMLAPANEWDIGDGRDRQVVLQNYTQRSLCQVRIAGLARVWTVDRLAIVDATPAKAQAAAERTALALALARQKNRIYEHVCRCEGGL